ncbi:MAG: hypothetical protein HUJ25_08685 [Crocinitomicaceae bacterium]|nr:hypothetical protein [Crocinitomicaceae bacterium]
MSNEKPLIIDKRDKVNGLYTYCQKCQRLIENRVCGKTGKRISTCKNTDKHMFKAIIAVPGTNGKKRKTRLFRTKDLSIAIQGKLDFEKELESLDYQSTNTHIKPVDQRPQLLVDCMAMYIGFLNNEGVESHMVKVRTKKHLWEVENYFEKFCRSLRKNGIDHTFFKIDQVNDQVVGMFHTFILDDLQHANKTYNKMIGLFRQFFDWLINKKGYNLSNPFVNVQRRKENYVKTIISREEFKQLLDVVIPENGYQTMPSGERKNRYREWMSQCFRLALETGLRREEFMMLKFTNVIEDDKGEPSIIEIENFKVNRQKGLNEKQGQKKYIPITKGLKDLLLEIGFQENRNSDNYLLGNDEKASRKTLIDLVSKAFTHFWCQTGIEKKAQLKHLRKTYLTALVGHFGDKAPVLSNHSGLSVLKKHYVNDKHLVAAANSFEVFKTMTKFH